MKERIRASESYRWYALGSIMLGTIMGPLDASVANVALPTISRSFHRGVDEAEWVLLAYMLVLASTLVLFGRLGDIYGQKRIYLGGFAVFGASSLACALAPSLEWLIAFRVIQAIGSAMLVSCTQAMIVDTFPAQERGRAIGFNGAAVAAGLSAGPVLGGAIVTYVSWHWIFLINVPISILALIVAAIVLRPGERKPEGIDVLGSLLSVVGLFTLCLPLSRAHVWGWRSPPVVILLVVAVASLVAFVLTERRVREPMLDLALFRNRLFAISTLAAFFYFVAISGIVFLVPLTAQLALGASPLSAGLYLLPLTLLNIVLAPLAGGLSDRIPVRFVSTTGAAIVATGALQLARLAPRPEAREIITAVAVTGVGTAVFSQPNNSAIMGSAPKERRGIAAGTLATARTTGQLLGVASAGAVYFARSEQLGPLAKTFAPATTYFAIVAAAMIAVAFISWVRE